MFNWEKHPWGCKTLMPPPNTLLLSQTPAQKTYPYRYSQSLNVIGKYLNVVVKRIDFYYSKYLARFWEETFYELLTI